MAAKNNDSSASRRSRGLGCITKRGKKYYYRYNIGGKIKQVSLKTENEDEAKRIVAKEYEPMIKLRSKEEVAVHMAVSRKLIKPIKKIKLDNAWEKYLAAKNRPDSSDSTLKGYERILKKFIEWIKCELPSIEYFQQIDEDVAKRYADSIWDSGISERTYNAYIKAMHLLFRVLVKGNPNPFSRDHISRKIENQQGHKKMSEEQILNVLDGFDAPKLYLMNKEEMRVLFYIGALTGLRLADCCLLKWNNVSFTDGIIRYIPIKTKRIGRKAIIPIAEELKNRLSVAWSWKENDFVLPKVADRYQRNPYGIRKDVLKVFKFSGLETSEAPEKGIRRKKNISRYGFHSFRHSFASIMATQGYSINMLAQILADDTKTLEKYYINIDEQAVKETFDKIFIPAGKNLLMPISENQNIIDDIVDILSKLDLDQLKKIQKNINKRIKTLN